jgi:molybdopterin/thiamine biosynthesis adenylyltransferase/nitroreductase
MTSRFDYEEAFSRNLGWVTEREQQVLRAKRVAIAGMGGVGGAHLLTLTRLGIGAFRIADPDRFELANFNRQVGAKRSTVGKYKVDVMAQCALDINAELNIDVFSTAIDENNVDQFLADIDLFVDGLDFFAFETRSMIFRRCTERGIPAITAAPIGMSAAYVTFLPGAMTFEQYFGLEACNPQERAARFLVGLTPKPQHLRYLVDRSRVALDKERGPSTAMACQLCAAIVGTEALKILLGRKGVRAAPHYQLFDIYRGKWVRGKLHYGHRNPLQRMKSRVAQHLYARGPSISRPIEDSSAKSEIERVLDLARWAPSGDNGQPWRFEVRSQSSVCVHVRDESEHDLYDRDGDFSLVSAGCLIENMRLAAHIENRELEWSYRRSGAHEHRIDVMLPNAQDVTPDPLSRFIRARFTDRSPFRIDRLNASQVRALESCVDDSLQLMWFETFDKRREIAVLNAMATDIRLRCREAFDVHRQVIDFERVYSPTGVSARAIGLDALLLRVMQWAFADFKRVDRLNSLLGTGAAQLELDLVPGLMCGAHFMVAFRTTPSVNERGAALVRAGQSIQRFWLEATRLGLSLQPGLAPIILSSYAEKNHPFTESNSLRDRARELAFRFRSRTGGIPAERFVFAGRIGVPRTIAAKPRSIRRPLEELMIGSTLEPRSRDCSLNRPSERAEFLGRES